MREKIGTGEAGVNSLPREEYFKECLPDVIAGIFCTYFGVPEPLFEENSSRLLFYGVYYPKRETITYNKPYIGLIIHELAHHITYKLHGTDHRHDYYFKKVLQEMHDYWR